MKSVHNTIPSNFKVGDRVRFMKNPVKEILTIRRLELCNDEMCYNRVEQRCSGYFFVDHVGGRWHDIGSDFSLQSG
jgi:hypothetical protein